MGVEYVDDALRMIEQPYSTHSEPGVVNSLSEVIKGDYRTVAQKFVEIKNTDVLDALNTVVEGEWKKVYEAGLHNGAKKEIHYFQNEITGHVFDVKVKYQVWKQKEFKGLHL